MEWLYQSASMGLSLAFAVVILIVATMILFYAIEFVFYMINLFRRRRR